MKQVIISWLDNHVIYEGEHETLKDAVECCVKMKISLNRASLNRASLNDASLDGASLNRASLDGASLDDASLDDASLDGASLNRASLNDASLDGASLNDASLNDASLNRASLDGASLNRASLDGASLNDASLNRASLDGASLNRASLDGASLNQTKGMIKIMGVEPGNTYWKRFEKELKNNGYQFYVGLNILRDGEKFADDERILCSYPGFHFGSRSWCAVNFPDRPYEARIRILLDAKINEPWATDGKASADKIDILEIFEVSTGKDVTEQFRRKE